MPGSGQDHFKKGTCRSWADVSRVKPNTSSRRLLKDTILDAAQRAGKGDIVAYLERQAEENPVAFLALLGRVLPLQVQNDRDNPVAITSVTYHIVDTREQAEMIELSALTNGTKEPN